MKGEVSLKIASKNLYLSRPAFSSQIKIVEYNIYSKLLVRKKNQIYFTPEGELVLDYASKILNLCQEADNAIALFKKLKRFRLKVGSTKSISWDLANGKIDIGMVQEDEVPQIYTILSIAHLISRKSHF